MSHLPVSERDPSRLRADYFAYPKLWRFNSPDFNLFYSALGAILAVAMILIFLLILASHRPVTTQQANAPVNVEPQSPVASQPASPQAQSTVKALSSAAPSPTNAVPSASPSSSADAGMLDSKARFDSAEQQPSYALRAEAYDKLRQAQDISYTDRIKATSAYKRYHALALDGQRQLDRALYGVKHQHYSQAIRQFKNIIASGEILGDAFLQAQQQLPKTYVKKIDYFLLQGQITQAHRALNEAKAAQVSDEVLHPYENKIKILEKASR